MTRRKFALGVAALASVALTFAPLSANAATVQDPASGTCHVDINLSSHKVKLGNNAVSAHITGTISNPNNCDLSDDNTSGGFSLTNPGKGWSVDSGLDALDNLDFAWSNNSLAYNFQPVLGTLTPTTDMTYVDNGANRYSIDAQWGNVVIDNAASQKVDVRYASRIKLTATRSGKTVTLKTHSTRFEYSNPYAPDAWGVSYQPKVTIQKLVGKAWKNIKTVTANYAGNVSVKVKTSKKVTYRAVSQNQTYVWSSTSKTVKR